MTTTPPASPTWSFDELRDYLYKRLLDHVRFSKHTTPNKRFFPCNTAADVLQIKHMKKIFDCLVAAGAPIPLSRDGFADGVKVRKLDTFLAILIYSQSTIMTVRSFVTSLVLPDQWPLRGTFGRKLGVLPISREDALTLLADNVAADRFWKNQDEFCAVIIRQNQEVICDSQQLLPYLQEEFVGQGAFSTVYRVKVAPHHFLSEEGLSNPKEYAMARKDFLLDEGSTHERERDFMRQILRNPKKHDNILKHLGSLQIGSTYSLFMELADYDLWDYMTIRHTDTPTTCVQKAAILHCAAELAAALAYLHDDLLTESFEKLSCFHLDLKPRNILVITEKDKYTSQLVQRWKLCDFNMSKAKAKRKSASANTLQRNTSYEFSKLFQKDESNVNGSSLTVGTANPRGEGTYTAPEASITGEKVATESDTWSLGCILCVVFSYLDSGCNGVTEFGDLRATMPKDQFFTISASKPRLSMSVQKWLKELKARAYRRNKEEGAIVQDFLDFLHDKVLVVDPEKWRKTRARDVAQQLGKAFRSYVELAKLYPHLDDVHPTTVPSKPTEGKKKRISLPFSRHLSLKRPRQVKALGRSSSAIQ
jgi:serine/threonine protein kinase